MMRIKLHIEQLVLEGLPIGHKDGKVIKAAVEAELARLLSDGEIGQGITSGGALPTIPGGHIEIAKKSQPQSIGKQIAGAIHGGLNR